jgi:hypothetical protein
MEDDGRQFFFALVSYITDHQPSIILALLISSIGWCRMAFLAPLKSNRVDTSFLRGRGGRRWLRRNLLFIERWEQCVLRLLRCRVSHRRKTRGLLAEPAYTTCLLSINTMLLRSEVLPLSSTSVHTIALQRGN